MRAIADGEDLKARLAANLQTVTWEQFTARGYTALPNVMELIYTEKQFVAQTTLKNYLTEIYRETIRRVFEGLADKDMMDHIEKVVLPELSEQTIRRLQDHVNKKRAITPADQIPSVPGLNVEVPKETKPVNGKHNEAAAPVNSNDETKAAISMPATPGAVAQSQPAPSLQLP